METSSTNTNYQFLQGGGEMGELTRNYNWSKNTLGTPDKWPQSLRTLVRMMLTSRFPMLIFWGPDLITFYNDAFRPSLGDNGKHPSSLGQRGEESWAESWPVIGPMIYTILAGGESVWFEDQKLPLYRNGRMDYAYWTYSFSPLTDDNDAVNGILVTCTETTQTVLARQQAQETQQQVLAFFEQSSVGIAIISRQNLTFQMANPYYGYLVGRSPDQLVGKPLLDALPELAGQGFEDLLEDVLATGKPFIANEVAVNIVRNQALETIYVDLSYQPRHEADRESGVARISGILVVAADVTQQVQSRQKIAEREARFRSLIEQAPVATGLFVGRQLIVELANMPMLRFWGKGPDVFGKPLAHVLPELDGQPFLKILDQVYATGQAYHARADRCDLVIDGQLQTFYFNFTYQPIVDEQGQVYAILDMAVDVTQQVIAQQKLEEAEASLRGAIELAQLGTWSIDVATNGLVYSDRLIDWFGHDPKAQDYNTVIPIIDAKDQPRVADAVARALTPESDGVYDEIYTVIHPVTGQKRVLHAHGKTVFDANGKAIRINGTAQDITLQRGLQAALETEVRQRTEQLAAANEELAAINEELASNNDEYAAVNEELEEANSLLNRSNDNLQQFAYVASHDLQEPLRKIQSFGNLLQNQYADKLGDGINYLERMQSAANRMSTLIRDLLSYSRISVQQDQRKIVSLSAVVQTVLTDLELVIADRGAVVNVDVDSLPEVLGDPIQLGQLFQNLLSNALKFSGVGRPNSPKGAKPMAPLIRISNQTLLARDLPASILPARSGPLYHRIDVTDNGIGFEQKYADRIFQVFQRLHGKNEFAGTGIGLAICAKVVANHGGTIQATSQPGKGATFSVYLPG